MRSSKDAYFLQIAEVVATQSTCVKHQVGAVLVRDNQILSTGYNGAPSGVEHCIDVGCKRPDARHGEQYELCVGCHAEQNAIIQCALHGASTKNSTVYITHEPCLQCAKMLINAKIKRVNYMKDLGMEEPLNLLKKAGVVVVIYG